MSGQSQPDEDDIDRIVAGWRQQRPDVDVTTLEVLVRIARLARALEHTQALALSASGLDGRTFDVLAALRRAGPPFRLSPGQLSVETLVMSGTMTNRIDHAERRGLVRRLPASTDRRGIIVELTEKGLAAIEAALDDLDEEERRVFAGLDTADRQMLASLLRRLRVPLGR